jgi:hypothetical protein
MAGLAETWSHIEVRSVIRFVRLKGTSPAEIHRQLVEVYGANVMSRKHVGFGALPLVTAGQTFKMSSDPAGQARPSRMTMCVALKV